ncbi:MAG: tetratricopeptide repeat protein [Nocardioides sp.]|uniref:tetratricopeptide repeat protein n=1 Tax=Nocardioides sp. TaxID=35761 RepID=UPI0039E4B0D1
MADQRGKGGVGRGGRGGEGAGRGRAGRSGEARGRSERGRSERGGQDRSSGGRGNARTGADGGRRGADARSGEPRGARQGRPGASGGRPGGNRKPRTSAPSREEKPARSADQRAYDGPDLPEDVTGKELDRSIAVQLRGLPEKLASRIARHLVAAGRFIDSDPELAYQHAKAAKARTQRVAVIREALGEAAYAAGHYAEALAELRAAKRMNGATAYLPIMADCHRALGHPEQAIKLAHSPSVGGFPPEAKAEMTIVEAGARRDMGELDSALRVLEQAPLQSKSRAPWVVRLRYAYADTLAAAGRTTDALTWFHRTHAIDADELTDAAARAAALEQQDT